MAVGSKGRAEGGTTAYTIAELLGATCLSGSSGTEAGIADLPLLPFSKPACLGSFACVVLTVLDSPATSEVERLGAVDTNGVY